MEPSALQCDELLRMAGTARFIWNWALERCKTFHRENKKAIAPSQLSHELTALKGNERWLYDFDSQSLQQVLKNLKQAYANHFNPKMRSGFPQFRPRRTAHNRSGFRNV
jgi:putative transposase